jgi:hypothetical protein
VLPEATLNLLPEPVELITSLVTELEEGVPSGIPHLGPLEVPGLLAFHLFVLARVLVAPVGRKLHIPQLTVS